MLKQIVHLVTRLNKDQTKIDKIIRYWCYSRIKYMLLFEASSLHYLPVDERHVTIHKADRIFDLVI